MPIYCGVDFHARRQVVQWCDTADGEIHQLQLSHQSPDEVRKFYAQFTGEVTVGLEASGYSRWFESLLDTLGHQVSRRRCVGNSPARPFPTEDRS